MRHSDRLVVHLRISKDTCGCVYRPLIVHENILINNIQLFVKNWPFFGVTNGSAITIKWRTFTHFIWIWIIDPDRFVVQTVKCFPLWLMGYEDLVINAEDIHITRRCSLINCCSFPHEPQMQRKHFIFWWSLVIVEFFHWKSFYVLIARFCWDWSPMKTIRCYCKLGIMYSNDKTFVLIDFCFWQYINR